MFQPVRQTARKYRSRANNFTNPSRQAAICEEQVFDKLVQIVQYHNYILLPLHIVNAVYSYDK